MVVSGFTLSRVCGEESAGKFGPVLGALEPVFDDGGQLGGERLAAETLVSQQVTRGLPASSKSVAASPRSASGWDWPGTAPPPSGPAGPHNRHHRGPYAAHLPGPSAG
jgi:hypothetical protein